MVTGNMIQKGLNRCPIVALWVFYMPVMVTFHKPERAHC